MIRTISVGAVSLLLFASAQAAEAGFSQSIMRSVSQFETASTSPQQSAQHQHLLGDQDVYPDPSSDIKTNNALLESSAEKLPNSIFFKEAFRTIGATTSSEPPEVTVNKMCSTLGVRCVVTADVRDAEINQLERVVKVNPAMLGGISPDGREFIVGHELGHINSSQSSDSDDDAKKMNSPEMKAALEKFFYVKHMDSKRGDWKTSFHRALSINSFEHFQSRSDLTEKEKSLIISFKSIADGDEYNADRYAAQLMFCRAAAKTQDPIAAARLAYRSAVHGLAGAIIMVFKDDIMSRPVGTNQTVEESDKESLNNIIELIAKSESVDHPTMLNRINAVAVEATYLQISSAHRESVCGNAYEAAPFVPANTEKNTLLGVPQ